MDYSLPTEFDLIVVGTGIVESIISAAASRIGKRVLQVDNNKYYGGHWASFSLEEIQKSKEDEKNDFEVPQNLINEDETFMALKNRLRLLKNFQTEWHVPKDDTNTSAAELHEKISETTNVEKNSSIEEENIESDEKPIEKHLEQDIHKDVQKEKEKILTEDLLKKESRKFIIDLSPKALFSRGNCVELLITSNIARYTEFRSVSRILTWIDGNLEIVPCSRSDVFANNKVSLVEKRMLMKMLTSIDDIENDLKVPETKTFQDFLKDRKLANNIIHFLLYGLSMSNNETNWLKGIKGTKRFLNSIGRYGKTPFLFSLYGSGEMPQAFCRLSAVFGGIFALDQILGGIITDKDSNFLSLICGNQKISAPHIVMNVGMAPEIFVKNSEEKFISRAVFITNKSLMQSEKEHITLLLYPIKNKLCTVIELGTLTGVCPQNMFLVHMMMEGNNPKEDFSDCEMNLFSSECNSEKPKVLWACYFSIPYTEELDLTSGIPKNIFLCPGPDLDLDYDRSIEKAKEIFLSLYPDEEFLPRAPDADEIIIGEDDDQETKTEDVIENPPVLYDIEKSLENEVSETKTSIEESSKIEENP